MDANKESKSKFDGGISEHDVFARVKRWKKFSMVFFFVLLPVILLLCVEQYVIFTEWNSHKQKSKGWLVFVHD